MSQPKKLPDEVYRVTVKVARIATATDEVLRTYAISHTHQFNFANADAALEATAAVCDRLLTIAANHAIEYDLPCPLIGTAHSCDYCHESTDPARKAASN
jgi:hypothetical protein